MNLYYIENHIINLLKNREKRTNISKKASSISITIGYQEKLEKRNNP